LSAAVARGGRASARGQAGSVALGLAPLYVTGQPVEVWEHRALVNPVPKQRDLQNLSMFIRHSYPNNLSNRLEVLRRSRVRRENATLCPQASSHDSGNVPDRFLDLEGAALGKWFAQVFLRATPSKDLSIFAPWTPPRIARFVLVSDTEIERDKWAPGPVEQPRGKAVMLGNRQKLPVILRVKLNTIC